MSVGMVAFWALALYGIVSLVRGETFGPSGSVISESPDEVLRRRLAEGR